MTLEVWTCNMRGRGDPDALDITRAGANAAATAGRPFPGEPWAPSAGLLWPTLRRMKIDPCGAWAAYVPAFMAEMRASYRERRAAWESLLLRPRVVLCCYCADHTRCHRTLVAGILGKLGADERGEMVVPLGLAPAGGIDVEHGRISAREGAKKGRIEACI